MARALGAVLVPVLRLFQVLWEPPPYVHSIQKLPIPDAPPALSPLADFNWTAHAVSQEEVSEFRRAGYVVLRGALDPRALHIMVEASEHLCNASLEASAVCNFQQARWQLDVFRDFWLHGPLGRLASVLIGRPGVRLMRDGIFSMRYAWRQPNFFSFHPHADTQGRDYGVWGALPSNTSGAAVWFPLHSVDPLTEGGSLNVWPGSHLGGSGVKRWGDHVKGAPVTLSFEKGDVAFLHPWMVHQTQPVSKYRFTRHAWFAWIAESDAIKCAASVMNNCNTSEGQACCLESDIKPGSKIHHPCFPQVHPPISAEELAAHFGPGPRPLVDPYGLVPRTNWWAPECEAAERTAELGTRLL